MTIYDDRTPTIFRDIKKLPQDIYEAINTKYSGDGNSEDSKDKLKTSKLGAKTFFGDSLLGI